MFNYRKVRENVNARLAIIGRVDEETIHNLYTTSIKEELERARASAICVKLALSAPSVLKAQSPPNVAAKWVMVDGETWGEIQKAFEAFCAELG